MERHENRIPLVVTLQHREVRLRVEMAGESEKSALPRLPRSFECLERAARGEDLFDILAGANVVHLPEIHVVSLQAAQRSFQILLSRSPRTLHRFGGDEDVLTELRKHTSI